MFETKTDVTAFVIVVRLVCVLFFTFQTDIRELIQTCREQLFREEQKDFGVHVASGINNMITEWITYILKM